MAEKRKILKKENSWLAFLLSVAISAVYFAGVGWIFGFHYAINDDIIMRNIASGSMTGTPDGHLIFTKYTWGWILAKAFAWLPGVDWYGIGLVSVMAWSLALLLNSGLRQKRSMKWKGSFLLLVLALYSAVMVLHVVLVEWTLAAAIAGSAAVYLFFSKSYETSSQKLFDEIAVAVLLWITYNIRSEIFIMLCPMFGISWLWNLWEERRKGHWNKKELRLVLLAAVPVLFTMGAEKAAYRSSQWEEYQAWNQARSDVMDYDGIPYYEENEAFYDSISVTSAEVRNLRHYALYLVEGIEGEKMHKIASEAQRQSKIQAGSLLQQGKTGVGVAWDGFAGTLYFPVNVLFVLAWLLAVILSVRYDKKYVLYCLGLAVVQGALWFYLGFQGRLPERVAFSMHLLDLALAASVCMRLLYQHKIPVKKWAGALLGMVLLGTAVWSFWDVYPVGVEKSGSDGEYERLTTYLQEQEDKVFLLDNHMEASRGASILGSKNFARSNRVTLGDWYSFSPLDEQRMEQLGLTDLAEALVENPSVYFVSDRSIDYVTGYLTERFGQVRCETVEIREPEAEFPFVIYQFALE